MEIRDPFKWTREELQQMNKWTRKLMTINKITLTKYMYQERREEEDLQSTGDSVDTSIQRLEDYIEKHERRLSTAPRNHTDNRVANRMIITNWKKNNSIGVLND